MSLTEAQRFHLKKFIKGLEGFRGRHTELVSVYIPQDYDMNKIINHLSQEQGTASNIKSASTRKNVTDALERMIQHLKLFKRTPPNGLVVFSGNVAEREGQQDFKVWSTEPPVPLKTRIYRCDKEFVLDILREMLEAKEHYKKVAEYMKEAFLNMEGLKGIIVGGPGPTKYDLIEGNFITNEVKKKVIAIKDLGYTGEFGLEELLEKSQDVLAQEDVMEEKKIVNRFLEMLATKRNMVAYGEADVINKLKMGVVDILLLSEDLSDEKIEEFEAAAKPVGSTVKIISTQTREGVQLRDLGKVAAILRYEVHG